MYLESPSGGFKVVYEYANRLQSRGHSVTVIHPRNIPGVAPAGNDPVQIVKSRLWKYKLRLKHRPLVPWFEIDPGVRLSLTPDLRERFIPDADAIVATAFQTSFPVAGYSGRKGRKFYLIQSYETWHGEQEEVNRSLRLPLDKIAISRWLLELARKFDQAGRVSYIPIGLDLAHFRITKPLRERDRPRVGMLSHPSEIKGTRDGLKALELARARIPGLQAVLFGTTPRGIEIPAWVEYIRLPSQPELVEIYNSCRVFLHPSWIEGWGLPAAEAMACGCALVATANGGVFEFAIDGEDALLAPIRSPERLAERLIEVLSDDDLRVRLARAGHGEIQKFTWDRAVDSLEKLLANPSSSTA